MRTMKRIVISKNAETSAKLMLNMMMTGSLANGVLIHVIAAKGAVPEAKIK